MYFYIITSYKSKFKVIWGKMHGSNCVGHLGCSFSEILQENFLNAIGVWPSCYQKACYNWNSSYLKDSQENFYVDPERGLKRHINVK